MFGTVKSKMGQFLIGAGVILSLCLSQQAYAAAQSPLTDDNQLDVSANLWGNAGSIAPLPRAFDAKMAPLAGSKPTAPIRFNPEYVTPGGLTLGARTDVGTAPQYDTQTALRALAPQGRSRTYVDKQYLYAEGGFGRISLGQAPGVGGQTVSYAPISARITGLDGASVNPALAWAPSLNGKPSIGRSFSAATDFANDSAKVTYFSPRLGGVQFAGAFTPKPDTAGLARAAAALRFSDFDGVINDPSRLTNLRPENNIDRAYEVGVNYDQYLGPVGVKGSLTYGAAHDPLGLTARADTQAMSLGVNLSLGDFTLGGAYGYAEGAGLGRVFGVTDPNAAANLGLKRERTSFDLGGTYAVNEWTLGLNFGYAETRYPLAGQNLTARAPISNGTEFSFDYNLAHGVDLISAVQFINFDAAGTDKSTNKITTNLLVGTQIKF